MMYGSLATGVGGLDLAVEAVFPGASPAWHAEFEKAPSEILERHWPGVPNLGDITQIDWAEVEPVDLLFGGYPCQPFSTAGLRKGFDDPRNLWPHFADAIRLLRPRIVVLENVAAHLSSGFGRVLGDLASLGFDAEWGVFRASDVGAPHRRARVFIIAFPHGKRPQGPRSATKGRSELAGDGRQALSYAGGAPGREIPGGAHGDEGTDGPENGDRLAGSAPASPDAAGIGRDGHGRSGPVDVDWGDFRPAIDRWERLTGRTAPEPLDYSRLSADFVEWMMGFPEGWTAGVGKGARLKALGNAVVPRQGELALRSLLGRHS